jgi:hypothetical protein
VAKEAVLGVVGLVGDTDILVEISPVWRREDRDDGRVIPAM